GVAVPDLDLVEINEAFAAMAVASSRILGLPHEIVNVNGSGCSLGHPVAATGARMVATTIFELRRRGGGLGRVGMCAGGGMGSGTGLAGAPPSYVLRPSTKPSPSRSIWRTQPTTLRWRATAPRTSS